MKQRKMISNVLCHVLLAVLGVIWVLPIFYVILTSFRAEGGSYKSYIWPKGFTIDNYVNLFNATNSMIDFKRWFLNTLIIAIISTIIAAFFTVCVAYCMSRLRFRLR
ncbi:MAG: sugar ABC transporter permease, partial [Oscillospiraceae bacterium]|nr:sugar ABC transporter permease [Oscillospiraceae bacterium]